jgi:gliding motility-associated protein GldM
MSIPKEPRQLMINVMYLVLTALLALNVSAEIFNAFDMVDKGLIKANAALDSANKDLPSAIKDSAKKSATLAKYSERVDVAGQISKEGSSYLSELFDKVVDEAGNRDKQVNDGDYITDANGNREFKGKRDYDATTRLLVDSGEGEKMKAKMLDIKAKYMALIDDADKASFESKMPIVIDDKTWKNSLNPKKSWSDFTFGHMPLGAVAPIFSKYTNDIKSAEAGVLNYLAGKVGLTKEVVLNKFSVVSAPKKSYVILGESFETDVFLSAAADAASNTGISIAVNGSRLPLDKDGKAKYTAKANEVGVRKYSAVASITNPITGKTDSYRSEFEYEVGQRSVAVSATKMNVFYIGVANPVAVSAAGVPSAQVKVSMTGGSIERGGDGNYVVRVQGPHGSNASITVSAPGVTQSFPFRIKKIPDPVPSLGPKERGGKIGNGTFKGLGGLVPTLENFDFEARCDIVGFQLVRVAKRQDPEFASNGGARISGATQNLQNKATPGDKYFFQDIKCKCPGDPGTRDLGQLVFDVQ